MDPHDERPSRPDHRPDARGTPSAEVDDDERSLIRWMLSLTPEQRLDVLQRHVDAVERLRAGT